MRKPREGCNSEGQPPELCSQVFYNNCYHTLTSSGLMIVNLSGDNDEANIHRIGKSFRNQISTVDIRRRTTFRLRLLVKDILRGLKEEGRLLVKHWTVEQEGAMLLRAVDAVFSMKTFRSSPVWLNSLLVEMLATYCMERTAISCCVRFLDGPRTGLKRRSRTNRGYRRVFT